MAIQSKFKQRHVKDIMQEQLEDEAAIQLEDEDQCAGREKEETEYSGFIYT